MDKLALHVLKSLFQVSQSFRLEPEDRPYVWRFHVYLVSQVDFVVSTMFLNQIVKHMSTVPAVG